MNATLNAGVSSAWQEDDQLAAIPEEAERSSSHSSGENDLITDDQLEILQAAIIAKLDQEEAEKQEKLALEEAGGMSPSADTGKDPLLQNQAKIAFTAHRARTRRESLMGKKDASLTFSPASQRSGGASSRFNGSHRRHSATAQSSVFSPVFSGGKKSLGLGPDDSKTNLAKAYDDSKKSLPSTTIQQKEGLHARQTHSPKGLQPAASGSQQPPQTAVTPTPSSPEPVEPGSTSNRTIVGPAIETKQTKHDEPPSAELPIPPYVEEKN